MNKIVKNKDWIHFTFFAVEEMFWVKEIQSFYLDYNLCVAVYQRLLHLLINKKQ